MRGRQAPHADHRHAGERHRGFLGAVPAAAAQHHCAARSVREPGQGRDRAASVNEFTALQTMFLEQLTTSIGIVLNSIEATMQTEGLLKQSQQLAGELQAQQKELQQTNEQLEQKAQ